MPKILSQGALSYNRLWSERFRSSQGNFVVGGIVTAAVRTALKAAARMPPTPLSVRVNVNSVVRPTVCTGHGRITTYQSSPWSLLPHGRFSPPYQKGFCFEGSWFDVNSRQNHERALAAQSAVKRRAQKPVGRRLVGCTKNLRSSLLLRPLRQRVNEMRNILLRRLAAAPESDPLMAKFTFAILYKMNVRSCTMLTYWRSVRNGKEQNNKSFYSVEKCTTCSSKT